MAAEAGLYSGGIRGHELPRGLAHGLQPPVAQEYELGAQLVRAPLQHLPSKRAYVLLWARVSAVSGR